MATFTKNNISINYEIHGTGSPIVLLHGATVDFNSNYANFGWIKSLNKHGFQVIGMDFRGHGKSDSSHAPEFYGTTNLTNDVINLLDHLKLKKVALIGYSIGTAIALNLLHKHSQYFSKAVLIATGDGLIGYPPFIFDKILPGLAQLFSFEKFPNHLPDQVSAYWNFADEIGLDKTALSAFALAKYPYLSPKEAATIEIPTLIISAEKDLVLGRGPQLAQALTNGQYLEMKDQDHFTLGTKKNTRLSTIDFLLTT
jgi:pimeloyl-ACP methyl ester carboxylesterase